MHIWGVVGTLPGGQVSRFFVGPRFIGLGVAYWLAFVGGNNQAITDKVPVGRCRSPIYRGTAYRV